MLGLKGDFYVCIHLTSLAFGPNVLGGRLHFIEGFADSCDAHLRSLEHDLKQLRVEEDEMLAGQRASRLSKWIQSSAKLRKTTGLECPDKIKKLGFSWRYLFPVYRVSIVIVKEKCGFCMC